MVAGQPAGLNHNKWISSGLAGLVVGSPRWIASTGITRPFGPVRSACRAATKPRLLTLLTKWYGAFDPTKDISREKVAEMVHDACESPRTEKTLICSGSCEQGGFGWRKSWSGEPRTWKPTGLEQRSRIVRAGRAEELGSIEEYVQAKSPINFVVVGPAGVEPCFSRDTPESMVQNFFPISAGVDRMTTRAF